jgi:hypothetical protein
MMELTVRFPQQFSTTTSKANFTFLPSYIQLIQKKHMELLGPVNLNISSWECQGFLAARFGEGLNDTRSGLFTNMVRLITCSIHFSYAWLCNWEHPFSTWPKGESLGTLHDNQTWRAPPTQCGTMQFLCALVSQLVDQLGTILSSAASSEIHHQRPQLVSFSHIGWLELLPTSYKVKETSLVSYKHNRKTKRCLAHLCLLPRNTCLPRRWTRLGVSSCFSHLGWTKLRRKKEGYGVPSWHY